MEYQARLGRALYSAEVRRRPAEAPRHAAGTVWPDRAPCIYETGRDAYAKTSHRLQIFADSAQTRCGQRIAGRIEEGVMETSRY